MYALEVWARLNEEGKDRERGVVRAAVGVGVDEGDAENEDGEEGVVEESFLEGVEVGLEGDGPLLLWGANGRPLGVLVCQTPQPHVDKPDVHGSVEFLPGEG